MEGEGFMSLPTSFLEYGRQIMLRDSAPVVVVVVAVVVVAVVVLRMRPRAIPLAMIIKRKSTHGFPFLSHDEYGAPLCGLSGGRSSTIIFISCFSSCVLNFTEMEIKRKRLLWYFNSIDKRYLH